MKESEFEEKKLDLEAAEWVAKRIKGFTASEQDAFFDWMAKDPRHGEWYARHIKTWKRLDRLAMWKPEHSDEANPDLLQNSRNIVPWLSWGAVAAVFVLGVFFLNNRAGVVDDGQESVLQNYVAEAYEKHILPDGSEVEMNGGAALKVNFDQQERRIDLVSSEAHFDVEHDPEKPFVVYAKGFEFEAIGTAFSVKVGENEVELLVTEGVVKMTKSPDVSSVGMEQETQVFEQEEVRAGQHSVARVDHSAKFEISSVDDLVINEMLSWKPRSLQFNEIALEEVIKEFNLRNEVQIIISDEELKQTVVVASFHTPNVEKLIGLLEATLGVEAHDLGSNRILLSKVE